MNNLRISHSLWRELIAHCRNELPKEACGILAGKAGKVSAVLPMPNVAAEPEHHYLVDNVAQLSAFRLMVEKGWELTGIYHSHPQAAAVPSASDIEQAYYPEALHLIIGMRSPAKPDARLYRLVKETHSMVTMRLIVQRPAQTRRQYDRQNVGSITWGCSTH